MGGFDIANMRSRKSFAASMKKRKYLLDLVSFSAVRQLFFFLNL